MLDRTILDKNILSFQEITQLYIFLKLLKPSCNVAKMAGKGYFFDVIFRNGVYFDQNENIE